MNAFNSFIFCPTDSHPGSLSAPPFSFRIPFLPSLFPLLSSTTSPPSHYPNHFAMQRQLPTWDDDAAFHREGLSPPWICSINSIYLACSFLLQPHKWKCFVGRCTSHTPHKGRQRSTCHATGTVVILFQAMAELLITLVLKSGSSLINSSPLRFH